MSVTLCSLLAASVVRAEEAQSNESIKAAARGFLEEQAASYAQDAEVTVGDIDSRLRLQACASPIEGFLPRGGRVVGNVTVGVRCAGPKPWTLYLQGQVRVMAPVVVTSRPLSRGETIGEDDVQLQEQDLARLTSGYFDNFADVIGKSVRWSTRAGLAITPHMVEDTAAVRRGDQVSIVAETAHFHVRVEGEAMAGGAPGQVIQVRNRSSKRVIDAEVVGPGVVRVRL